MMTAQEKYEHDPVFHSLVRHLEILLSESQFTPSELREAIIFAATLHEMRMARNIKPTI